MKMKTIIGAIALLVAVPAAAQTAPAPAPAPQAGHAQHHQQGQMDHSKMDHSKMDHSKMDHSKMDHSKMDHEAHMKKCEEMMKHHSSPAAKTGQAGGAAQANHAH
jgi:Cu2+-exporting ATPase